MKKNEKYQHNEVGENWLYGIISDLEKAKAYARFGIDNDKQLPMLLRILKLWYY